MSGRGAPVTYNVDMDEEALIDGCQRGDRDARRRVYEQHVERIHQLARRLLRDDQDAFDVTQDTFVRAFERMDSFGGRSGLGTWLYRIATNEALQLMRRRRTERNHAPHIVDFKSRDSRPDADQTRLDVCGALAQLSDEEQAVLALKYDQDLSYGEIGAVLDCPPGTVASRLNRARAQLRRILDPERKAAEETGPPRIKQ